MSILTVMHLTHVIFESKKLINFNLFQVSDCTSKSILQKIAPSNFWTTSQNVKFYNVLTTNIIIYSYLVQITIKLCKYGNFPHSLTELRSKGNNQHICYYRVT